MKREIQRWKKEKRCDRKYRIRRRLARTGSGPTDGVFLRFFFSNAQRRPTRDGEARDQRVFDRSPAAGATSPRRAAVSRVNINSFGRANFAKPPRLRSPFVVGSDLFSYFARRKFRNAAPVRLSFSRKLSRLPPFAEKSPHPPSPYGSSDLRGESIINHR